MAPRLSLPGELYSELGSDGRPRLVSLSVPLFWSSVLGETHAYLFSVSGKGHMKVWRDGVLVAEKPSGRAPRRIPRKHLYVGRTQFYIPRGDPGPFSGARGTQLPGLFGDLSQSWKGAITGIKIWDEEVGWEATGAFCTLPPRETMDRKLPFFSGKS